MCTEIDGQWSAMGYRKPGPAQRRGGRAKTAEDVAHARRRAAVAAGECGVLVAASKMVRLGDPAASLFTFGPNLSPRSQVREVGRSYEVRCQGCAMTVRLAKGRLFKVLGTVARQRRASSYTAGTRYLYLTGEGGLLTSPDDPTTEVTGPSKIHAQSNGRVPGVPLRRARRGQQGPATVATASR